MMEDIIFPEIETPVYYTCSSKPAMHVDDCFEFKRYYILDRCSQQNSALNTIWTIISNAVSFYLKRWCFANKLLVDDTKQVCREQKVKLDRIPYTSADSTTRASCSRAMILKFFYREKYSRYGQTRSLLAAISFPRCFLSQKPVPYASWLARTVRAKVHIRGATSLVQGEVIFSRHVQKNALN